jgi:hypothetical protein
LNDEGFVPHATQGFFFHRGIELLAENLHVDDRVALAVCVFRFQLTALDDVDDALVVSALNLNAGQFTLEFLSFLILLFLLQLRRCFVYLFLQPTTVKKQKNRQTFKKQEQA